MTRIERVLTLASIQPITLTFASRAEASNYRKRLYKLRARRGRWRNISILLRNHQLRLFPRPGDPS